MSNITGSTRRIRLLELWGESGQLSYCEAKYKQTAHKDASTVLRNFALNHLGLTEDQFDVRSNPAGVAISGEVTLHTDPFGEGVGIYVQISDSGMGPRMGVLYRTCTSRTDYTGGGNNFIGVADAFDSLESEQEFAASILRLVGGARPQFSVH